jgi:hypothetical protein
MLISVGTNARPLAGIVMSFALYKSCPAAYGLPFVGALAVSLSSRTWSCCCSEAAAATLGAMFAGGCRAAMLDVLVRCAARGVGVAAPESGSWRGSVEPWVRGEGSITFVRFGRGEFGREGGSWVVLGVAVGSVDIFCVQLTDGPLGGLFVRLRFGRR